MAVYSARSWAELGAICRELPHGEFYLALLCRPTRAEADVSYNLDEDILRPPFQGWIAGDYEFDPEEPPLMMEESDNEEELQGTAESDSDSEAEEEVSEEARAIFEQCMAIAEPVELPDVKRWEGEPEPSLLRRISGGVAPRQETSKK